METNVRAIRAAQKMTQQDIVNRCSFGRSYLSKIEAGQANPTVATLDELSKALGVAVVDLLQRDKP